LRDPETHSAEKKDFERSSNSVIVNTKKHTYTFSQANNSLS